MSKPNPLIFVPSPRNIQKFNESTANIKADKLWIKFYPEEHAYQVARDYFLEHNQYTHLVVLPDDLLITPTDFYTLRDDAETYDVISGWCRNTIRLTPYWKGEQETEDMAESNISFHLPPNPPAQGTYGRYRFISIPFIDVLKETNQNIVEVKYAGFPLTFISRNIVEQVPFRRQDCCVDSCFAIDLDKKGIKQYSDLRVRTIHMNIHPDEIMVGKREKQVIFESP